MNKQELKTTLASFLSEDVGGGDVTSKHTPEKTIRAVVYAKEEGVLAGLKECLLLLSQNKIRADTGLKDGASFKRGDKILELTGSSRTVLTLERTLLNILGEMSGIATLTRSYVKKARATNPRINVAATRKTTPLFRFFEKKAVVLGGGLPHRRGLYDQVLIKDNHITVFGGVKKAVETLKKKTKKGMKVEVEVSNLGDAVAAAKAGADIIMLDNLTPKQAARIIKKLDDLGLRKRVVIEVSGGVRLNNVADYAKTGADFLSSSDLICGARSLDFSLKILKQ